MHGREGNMLMPGAERVFALNKELKDVFNDIIAQSDILDSRIDALRKIIKKPEPITT